MKFSKSVFESYSPSENVARLFDFKELLYPTVHVEISRPLEAKYSDTNLTFYWRQFPGGIWSPGHQQRWKDPSLSPPPAKYRTCSSIETKVFVFIWRHQRIYKFPRAFAKISSRFWEKKIAKCFKNIPWTLFA
jgi:hypothetical protein